jgi:hypothetical protein
MIFQKMRISGYTFGSSFLLWIACLFPACQNTPLERALKIAGENRKNMEWVLEYYRQAPADTLKLKAAVFLIENMPGHYSYSDLRWQEDYYREIENAVDPEQTNTYNKEIIEEISAKYESRELETVQDSSSIL